MNERERGGEREREERREREKERELHYAAILNHNKVY